jgi:hypothetical protein
MRIVDDVVRDRRLLSDRRRLVRQERANPLAITCTPSPTAAATRLIDRARVGIASMVQRARPALRSAS